MHVPRVLALLASTALLATANAHAQTLPADSTNMLRFMIEEEKLAGDVYRAFGSLYPAIKPFQNIPKSETTHYNALIGQAGVAGVMVSDLTSLASGHYLDATLQSLYVSLLSEGGKSSFAALTVGKNIELKDIADIDVAMAGLSSSSSLYTVYGNLRNGSNNHLNAFNNWLAMTPPPPASGSVSAPVPEPETYAMMLAGLGLVGGIARRRKALALA